MQPNNQSSFMGANTQGNSSRRVVDQTARYGRYKAPASDPDFYIAKITGGNSTIGFAATCYPEYPLTADSFSAIVMILEIAVNATIPTNTYMLVHLRAVATIGGT